MSDIVADRLEREFRIDQPLNTGVSEGMRACSANGDPGFT
jgi:hypothetical protein